MPSLSFRVLVFCTVITVCSCYPYLQESIPNGKNVPHPCVSGVIWEGVGHENRNGAGTRNPFGLDFKQNNLVWNAEICNKDSDGDGKTNGEELGDPDCTWSPGSVPKYTSGLSHPGVCEPVDSELCGRPSYVNCEDTGKFECSAIKEEGTFNYTVRFPETAVPAKETTYICITFEFPMDQEYHLVAYEPFTDNRDVMHHTLVYGCEGADVAPRTLMQTKECGGVMDGCRELISTWGAGSYGACLDNNMGFLIGANKGLKYAVMQHHWNNPQQKAGLVDSSGITFYLTPKLRPHNAGVFMIGQVSLNIPPGESYYTASGSCSGDCMSQLLDGNIYVSQVANHMHLLGAAQDTELRRNNSFVMHLGLDKVYDYNTPVIHIHKDPVMIHKGDELKTTCYFNSETRTQITKYGDATSDEMCFAFLTYYPKENLKSGRCNAWKSLDRCNSSQKVIGGCNTTEITDFSHPKTKAMIETVQKFCKKDTCQLECLDYVRELKQQPCFHGDIGDFMRISLKRGKNSAYILSWFALLDSCDLELQEEQEEITSTGCHTTSYQVTAILFTSVLLLFTVN